MAQVTEVMLTTVDNPYDPFENFESWYNFDIDHGYDSCGYLDRIAKTSNALSDNENRQIIADAIDEIVKYDPLNVFMKVSRTVETD